MAPATGSFAAEEMSINEGLGYPKAYAKLCRMPHLSNPYASGPPSTFIPYSLSRRQVSKASELDNLFPIIDLERKPSANPRSFASILWKQLDHLGNAGFDPAKFRIDPYGNVLYIHADSGSPLSWDINHWFPCSRGGMTIPSNLRVLQWQVCKKMQNKLEFLIPWWDLQLGVSVNQFLSMFASKNSNFRSRAFSFLFIDGETQELNASQSVDSHRFPHHFIEEKKQVGLAPAAIVSLHEDANTSTLNSIDLNTPLRSRSNAVDARKSGYENAVSMAIQPHRQGALKENELDMSGYPIAFIAIERNSSKHAKETEIKLEEMYDLEEELQALKRTNEAEKRSIEDLESMLLEHKRRVEKLRKLAEEQSSYKVVLEKMIRDAMHQSVIYKEQIRLNQVANSTLMARLEAQRAICNSSENNLLRQLKRRDEIEKQIRPYLEQGKKKRLRVEDTPLEKHNKTIHFVPVAKESKPSNGELNHLVNITGMSSKEQKQQEEQNLPLQSVGSEKTEENCSPGASEGETKIDCFPQKLLTEDSYYHIPEQEFGGMKKASSRSPQEIDDEEYARKIGKENIDKWLQMLLDHSNEDQCLDSPPQNSGEQNVMIGHMAEKPTIIKSLEDTLASGIKGDVSSQTSSNGASDEKAEKRDGHRCIGALKESHSNVSSACSGVCGYETSQVRDNVRGLRGNERRKLVRKYSSRGHMPLVPSPLMASGMRNDADCKRKKLLVGVNGEDAKSIKFFQTPIADATKKVSKK